MRKTVFLLQLNFGEVSFPICWSSGFSRRAGKGTESALPWPRWRPRRSSCRWARTASGTAHWSCTVWSRSRFSEPPRGRRSRRSVGTSWSFPSRRSPATGILHNSSRTWGCTSTGKKSEGEKHVSKPATMSVFRWQAGKSPDDYAFHNKSGILLR